MKRHYNNHTLPKEKGLKNKKMNDATYKQRREVMDCVYKIKNHVRQQGYDIPRINVRIVEPQKAETPLGCGRPSTCTIWIPTNILSGGEYYSYLFHVVAHEILHAAYGVGHSKKCKLMHPNAQRNSDEEVLRIFTNYVKKKS